MNLSSPPIIDGKVALDDAIRFIAKQVYPNEVTRVGNPRSDALKRVRVRVRYAYNKKIFGKASYHPTNEVDAISSTGPAGKRSGRRYRPWIWESTKSIVLLP
jgi:hypothetical protein